MRVFTKIELDTNSKAIICTEDGIEITYEAFPSLPAFKVNGLECVNDRLIANNKPELTAAERQQIQAWMDATAEK
jgi:hypothetical protein|tara:strand:+ start:112 stop:336 length:225 start_codon:yes stop_codon:yes gene_type:complete